MTHFARWIGPSMRWACSFRWWDFVRPVSARTMRRRLSAAAMRRVPLIESSYDFSSPWSRVTYTSETKRMTTTKCEQISHSKYAKYSRFTCVLNDSHAIHFSVTLFPYNGWRQHNAAGPKARQDSRLDVSTRCGELAEDGRKKGNGPLHLTWFFWCWRSIVDSTREILQGNGNRIHWRQISIDEIIVFCSGRPKARA